MSVRIHYFKTWPEPFEAAAIGAKLHEIRKDDRDPRPRAGDVVVLREWEPHGGACGCSDCVGGKRAGGEYTGRELPPRRVTYVSTPGTWGLAADVYVMTLLPMEAPR